MDLRGSRTGWNFLAYVRRASNEACLKSKKTPTNGVFFSDYVKVGLGCFFDQPIPQVEVLLDFPAFVTVFQCFSGLIIDFTEGRFGVSDCIIDYVQCFGHSSIPFSGRTLA